MPNPIIPGGISDSPTNVATLTEEELKQQEAARKEAEEAAKREAEEKAKKEAEETAAKKDETINDNETKEEPSKIILTTNEGDVEYELNENGDAVKDGEVVYTKAQLDAMEAGEQEDEITVADIAKISGINPLNSDGSVKEYEMTVESLAQREADIVDIARRQGHQEAIDNFFKANPDIYQAAVYKQTYGSLEGFANHIDWTTMSLDGKSEAQLEAIIRSAEKRKGSSDNQIDRIVRFSKADQVLAEVAKESLEYLAASQKAEIEAAEAERDREYQEAQAQLDRAYGITYDENGRAKVLNIEGSLYDKVVNKGTIAGLQIPTSGVKRKINGKEEILTRKDLVRYLTEPVVEVNGSYYTQAQRDVLSMLSDDEMFAAIAIRNLLGADVNQLAEATIRTQAVRRLNITSNGKPKVKVSRGSSTAKVNPNRRPLVPGGAVDSN